MKGYFRRLACFSVIIISAFQVVPQEVNLPKIELLGGEYYYYDVSREESLYGIAKKFKWDINELIRHNPKVSATPEKGTRLYYPTGLVTVVTQPLVEDESDDIEVETIHHTVKKGETIYSISRQYNISLDQLYSANPQAKHGVKTGEEILIPQNKESVKSKYLFYKIKKNDTLYSVSQKFNTTIEDILKANSGLSEKNFIEGETIRISVNSNKKRVKTELVEEERLAALDSYKVKKDDTWSSIAKNTGVDENKLKEINEIDKLPAKNEIINVPIIDTIKIEKEIKIEDVRELSKEGIKEIYDSIHGGKEPLESVTVALILDEPASNKDIDFTRGFLLALKDLGVSPYNIDFNVIDGRVGTNSLVNELDVLEPDLIITTADRNFPLFLADYGNENNIEIINVFDVRNDLYEDNPSIVQLLPPTSIFNEMTAERLLLNYGDRNLILVGDPDESDGVAEALKKGFRPSSIMELKLSEFTEFQPDDIKDYLIYSYGNKKEEVADILQTIENFKENGNFSVIDVIGRPNWILFTDELGDKFHEYNIIIPTRIWLDTESSIWTDFENKYLDAYDGYPVKSLPNFAATGYDIASYFLPATVYSGGDFNNIPPVNEFLPIQSKFNLKRVNNWGGFINNMGYLIIFKDDGTVSSIVLK